MRVLIAGGGTAGHVFPAIALAQQLVADNAEVSFAGTVRGLETRLVPKAGFELSTLRVIPFPRKISTDLVRAPTALIRAMGESKSLVEGCEVVVGMGGYASVAPVLAAMRAGVPVVLHEQNAVPGAANQWLSRRARAVALSFPEALEAFPRRVRKVITGDPVRSEIAAVRESRESLRQDALVELDLDPDRRTLVVFGGSQGALHLNQVMTEACEGLADIGGLQVLLLTGPAHIEGIRRSVPPSGSLAVRAVAFLDRMELAYSLADLVIARAGATTIAEITACGLPAILIPYPHATANHQEANARALERAGGAKVILDGDLNAGSLMESVGGLLADTAALHSMAARSSAWGRPDAARSLADLVTSEGKR